MNGNRQLLQLLDLDTIRSQDTFPLISIPYVPNLIFPDLNARMNLGQRHVKPVELSPEQYQRKTPHLFKYSFELNSSLLNDPLIKLGFSKY